MRLRKRLAELEARIEALEEPESTEWTTVPSAPDITMPANRAAIWRDAVPPLASDVAVIYDPMELDAQLGGYL